MRSNGRNERNEVLVVDKPPTFMDGGAASESQDQLDDDVCKGSNDNVLEKASACQEKPSQSMRYNKKKAHNLPLSMQLEYNQYVDGVQRSTKVTKPLEECWKNHIFLQQNSNHANVTLANIKLYLVSCQS